PGGMETTERGADGDGTHVRSPLTSVREASVLVGLRWVYGPSGPFAPDATDLISAPRSHVAWLHDAKPRRPAAGAPRCYDPAARAAPTAEVDRCDGCARCWHSRSSLPRWQGGRGGLMPPAQLSRHNKSSTAVPGSAQRYKPSDPMWC